MTDINQHRGEIYLMDYWNVIKKYKKMIFVVVAVSCIVAAIISIYLPKVYKAETTLLPISKGSGGLSSIASQFGGLASLAGLSLSHGGANDVEKLMSILKSRTLAENVIREENLMPILFKKLWNDKNQKWISDDPKNQPQMESAVGVLGNLITIVDDKKRGLIRITGFFSDRDMAARLANAYVSELQKFINAHAFTAAKRNRIFIESQLIENKKELLNAGKEISDFYRDGRVSTSQAKLDVPISYAELDMDALETTMIGQQTELEEVLAKKNEIEQKISDVKIVKDVPQQVYLTYLMLRRELLAKVNAMLVTQYEMAKIDEAKEDLSFQVIDKAVPPLLNFKPQRKRLVQTAFVTSLFFTLLLVFFLDYRTRPKTSARSI